MKHHLDHLRVVFDILRKSGIRLRVDKCIFAASEAEYLNYIDNNYSYSPTKKYKLKIINIPLPHDKDELRLFLGLVAFVHQFIPDLHNIAAPFDHLNNSILL